MSIVQQSKSVEMNKGPRETQKCYFLFFKKNPLRGYRKCTENVAASWDINKTA